VSPETISSPATGASGAITVTTAASCAWTASSDAAWVAFSAGTSGSGSGAAVYVVAPSTVTTSRTATLAIAGRTVTVTQAAASPPPQPPAPSQCTYSISPESRTIGMEATTLHVTVTTQAGCSWREEQEDPWLQRGTVRSGVGNGTADVDVERYKGNSQRTGTMTIAGRTFTVTQTK
jgi:hypothetical protein